ncbi:hypothetical protein IWQ56_001332 [Coemansia nantahalensis]|uniref:Uncharacterized protein n=2 Tax=Coemansia TaxID=4863 RepID=A0ACC1LH10_9FUNG|nr:hypothetical protein IWQ56_001332 [Coemansia nantahalensis]KAJ2773160.1 hypothetical protein IWQ57_001435 [Coemansia nantahalensis]KAJ2807452.1 hypothetical protein H4R21_000464 [Coemansia helicoidea]
MMADEREENLREMAALGNLKAVQAYIRSGVNVNSQNKMNGRSALHWACVRGNQAVAELLIRAGADTSVADNKGQTPLDVCKSDATRAVFPGYSATDLHHDEAAAGSAQDVEPERSFVPHYLAHPDLSKAWGIPDDALVDAPRDSGYMRQLQHEASVKVGQREPVAPAAGAGASAERELLVYSGQHSEECLVGSVVVDAQALTVAELGQRIREELDGVPTAFGFARYNGKQTVPVGVKQEAFSVARVFRGSDDAVVLRATTDSSH